MTASEEPRLWKRWPLGEPTEPTFPSEVADAIESFARRITEAKERRIRNALANYTFPLAMILDCPAGHIPIVLASDDEGREWHLFPLVREEYPAEMGMSRDTWLRVREAATADEVAQSLDTVRALLAPTEGKSDG